MLDDISLDVASELYSLSAFAIGGDYLPRHVLLPILAKFIFGYTQTSVALLGRTH
jgi:hypothetical protein